MNAITPRSGTLAPAERLLIGALSAWAVGRNAGAAACRTAAAAVGARTSPRVGALFSAWLQAVEASCRRPIRCECAGCGGPGPDLQRLVVACGVAPVDLDLGARLISPLVDDTETVMVLGRSLNAALAACGWPLPARLGPPPAATARNLH